MGAAAFTKTALDGGREMGLTTAEMLAVISSLSRRNFYKSNDHGCRSPRLARCLSR
jgi:motility quorum-sensing regulator/GCU-specific mRNA interferase toxin